MKSAENLYRYILFVFFFYPTVRVQSAESEEAKGHHSHIGKWRARCAQKAPSKSKSMPNYIYMLGIIELLVV